MFYLLLLPLFPSLKTKNRHLLFVGFFRTASSRALIRFVLVMAATRLDQPPFLSVSFWTFTKATCLNTCLLPFLFMYVFFVAFLCLLMSSSMNHL